MATQEIGLNEYLEEHGIAAVETDLAELIVQLGHDKPSHILVPAIHKNRTQVRDIFLAEMEDAPADLTDEPRRLAMAAREHLRRKFLSARVAVSGANFGIADTGTLCVLESEGNGRMCLTLPQTLITVMGIEKLLPTFTDLEVFLQLLPTILDRGADEPVHVVVDGCALPVTDRRSSTCPARQWAHQCAGRPGGKGCAALHPLLGVPERVPGVRADRRARLRLGLPGPDRRGPHSATDRDARAQRPELVAAVRVLAVWGMLRRMPGQDRHPEPAGGTAGRAVDNDRGRTIPGGWDAAMRAAAWVMSDEKRFAAAEKALGVGRVMGGRNKRIRHLPPPLSAWTASRDLPAPPAQTFRSWWKNDARRWDAGVSVERQLLSGNAG